VHKSQESRAVELRLDSMEANGLSTDVEDEREPRVCLAIYQSLSRARALSLKFYFTKSNFYSFIEFYSHTLTIIFR